MPSPLCRSDVSVRRPSVRDSLLMTVSRRSHSGSGPGRPRGSARGTRGALIALRLQSRRAFTLIEVLAALSIIGLLIGLAYPRLQEATNQARIARAIGDLRAMTIELNNLDFPPTSLAAIGRLGKLDPWGRPYVYYKFPPRKSAKAAPPGARKDRFLVPINSYFDLYSVGKDGGSAVALTAKMSQDDIVVANDGGFVGLASKY